MGIFLHCWLMIMNESLGIQGQIRSGATEPWTATLVRSDR